MENKFEISEIAANGNEVLDAINSLNVFEVVNFPKFLLDKSLSKKSLYENEEGNYLIELKLKEDIVLSKAMFKLLVNSVEKNYFKGVSVKKNMFLLVNRVDAIYEISKKSSKGDNEKRKEILKNRLNGDYKMKHKEGKVWNKDGI